MDLATGHVAALRKLFACPKIGKLRRIHGVLSWLLSLHLAVHFALDAAEMMTYGHDNAGRELCEHTQT